MAELPYEFKTPPLITVGSIFENEKIDVQWNCVVDEVLDDEMGVIGVKIKNTLTNEISEICPSISENVISASYCPTDGHADPIDTLRAYKEAAQKNGVIFTNNEEVLEISEKGKKIFFENYDHTSNNYFDYLIKEINTEYNF